jgi:ribonuclease E
VAAAPFVAVVDEEQVRAAVTVALDASMAVMVDEIAKRVLASLATSKRATAPDSAPAAAPAAAHPPAPAPDFTSAPIEAPKAAQPAPPVPMPAPAPIEPRIEPVRRVTPLRHRTGSILGLDISPPEPESSETERE